jgi:imidazolonepropionase-like amidohydrolase
MCYRLLICLVFMFSLALAAQANDSIPAPPQSRPIALVGGDIYPVSGEMIAGGTVVFDAGRIVAVGRDIAIPEGAERIDVAGKRVYPGLIDSWTTLGLIEISSVRATNDRAEVGPVNPNVRVERAVNPDSEIIPTVRSNGVLLAITAPESGQISGMAAVIALDGWTWEDMTVRAPAGLVINWPNMLPARGWNIELTDQAQNRARDEALARIEEAFDLARAYRAARTGIATGPAVITTQPTTAPTPEPDADQSSSASVGQVDQPASGPATQPAYDARWDAMIPVLDRTIPVFIVANELSQIQAAIAFAQRQQIRMILVGGRDAALVADLLKQTETPVIIEGIHRRPGSRSADYDEAFTLPERLRTAGVRFAISADRGATDVRNLPFHVATAVAFGLPAEAALKSITLDAATILGVADRFGSIEPGKSATLIVTTGDVLETATNVEHAFIDGRHLDLSDRHKQLWRKYQEKYRQQNAAPAR